MSGEYRVKVSVRNNLILAAIEGMGFRSVAEFCKHYGLKETGVSALVALRKAPINLTGEFCLEAKALMEALGAAPSDLWTDAQLTMRLLTNSREKVVDESSVRYLIEEHEERMLLPDPADVLSAAQTERMVEEMLTTLSPKREKVLRMRLGIGTAERTLQEVGEIFGMTRERARQIEAKGLRTLRARLEHKETDA